MTVTTEPDDFVFREKKAAAFIGISFWQLQALRRRGEITYVQLGERAIGYRVRDLIAYVNARVVQPRTDSKARVLEHVKDGAGARPA